MCEHLAALAYAFAREIDRDPAVLLAGGVARLRRRSTGGSRLPRSSCPRTPGRPGRFPSRAAQAAADGGGVEATRPSGLRVGGTERARCCTGRTCRSPVAVALPSSTAGMRRVGCEHAGPGGGAPRAAERGSRAVRSGSRIRAARVPAAANASGGGTSQPKESASRTIMLKNAQTRIASMSASRVTPAASTASASPGASSPARASSSRGTRASHAAAARSAPSASRWRQRSRSPPRARTTRRAVGVRSEVAAVEERREAREQLPLAW